jgi:hypothetical protein
LFTFAENERLATSLGVNCQSPHAEAIQRRCGAETFCWCRFSRVPVARILPFLHGSGWEQEAQLVASGAMKVPEEEMDWELFFGERTGNVSHEAAVQAAIDSRGDR